MRVYLLLLFFAQIAISAPLQNHLARIEIKKALENAARIMGQEGFYKEAIARAEQMDGERVTYNTPMPALYTIKDGVFLIKQTLIDSFSILRTSKQLTNDEDLFKRSSARPYRFPFVNSKGMMLKKSIETHLSIYYLTYRKEIPAYIKASGSSKVFLLGDSFAGSSFEVWLHDDAELIVENLVQAALVTIHVRDRAKITIKKGTAENVYISSRAHTRTDLANFLPQSIVLNTTNGPIGDVIINPQKSYFMLGSKLQGSLECRSSVKPEVLNSKKFKTRRFFVKSLPRHAAKTIKGMALAGGYAAVFSLLVVSIVHGIFPALAAATLAKNALIGATASFGVGMTIRGLVKKIRPESLIRSSI